MRDMTNGWAVVLAGGDGVRLRSLTTMRDGLVVPKQYCSLGRPDCLLQDAVKRAHSIASPAQVCSVVAAQHRRWWVTALSGLSESNIFVQPQNRGTGYGMLLALLKLERINPSAIVTLLPADHYFKDEGPIVRALRSAGNLARENPQTIYLLGTEPDRADSELGYILPAEEVRQNAVKVEGFIEKPDGTYAQELLRLGALWNLFMLVGGIGALLELFRESHAQQLKAMSAALDLESRGDSGALARVYEESVPIDFSRDVLELQTGRLKLLRVSRCGWTDLGTPQRVEATVRHLSASEGITREPPRAPAPLFLDLSGAPI